MKFSEFHYQRPDMKEVEATFNNLLEKFKEAHTFEEQDKILHSINNLRNEIESMGSIANIRYMINSMDQQYQAEQDYFNEIEPVFMSFVNRYYHALVNSKYRKELEEKWGKQLFTIAESTLKSFSPQIVEDLQVENKLCNEYARILASARIIFNEEERTLPQLIPYQLSTDREMRKKANEAKYAYLKENELKIDTIYDELVKVRTRISRKLGYKNFIELGYARLNRTDYNKEMVENFRKQVQEYIVPVAVELKVKQRNRIGVETLCYYDDKLNFKTGNAKLKGNREWFMQNIQKMYMGLSAETNKLFTFMMENELMDLISKKGKAPGGYCLYISEFTSPFIILNTNGISDDVEMFTHEFGHAFQRYLSRSFTVPEYFRPTLEAGEIHSMTMELFTWTWMDYFFKEDANKYRYNHLCGALLFIPYGAAVDEFQHFIYENPEATPTERKKTWREIEKKYLPYLFYEDNEYLNNGAFWHQQGHIFMSPFYYIDYALAQICAFQFWKRGNEDKDAAWRDYLTLCQAGGSLPFTELLKLANLHSPFKSGCVQLVIGDIKRWLDSIDDRKL